MPITTPEKLTMTSCVIIFAKNPLPNQVKTRLLPYISAEQSASLYRAFLIDWCETLSQVATSDRIVAYTPSDSLNQLQTLIGENVTYIPQVGSGLGERLTSACRWACNRGYEKILMVGSDSPTLPVQYLDEALKLLQFRDIVIGPSTDGLYYLIGFSKVGVHQIIPSIFTDVEWSSNHVLRQTLEKVELTGTRLGLLPPWYDVDTPTELQFLRDHLFAMQLAEHDSPAPQTAHKLAEFVS